MKTASISVILAAAALGTGAALAQSETLTDEQPMTVGGVETACTGTSLEVRSDPRWTAYPFHLEVAGKDGQYLGDEKVTVTGNGHSVSVQCPGPWVLMKLPAGSYHVSLDVPEGGHRDLTMRVPGKTVVHFPGGGGETTPNGRVAQR
jgi:hypothetical protein